MPNAATGSLDLLVADGTKGQILRYARPNYGTATVVYSHAATAKGPERPSDLSVDAAGNLYVASSGEQRQPPSLWVLPVNAKGVYQAPVLIDQSFHGAPHVQHCRDAHRGHDHAAVESRRSARLSLDAT